MDKIVAKSICHWLSARQYLSINVREMLLNLFIIFFCFAEFNLSQTRHFLSYSNFIANKVLLLFTFIYWVVYRIYVVSLSFIQELSLAFRTFFFYFCFILFIVFIEFKITGVTHGFQICLCFVFLKVLQGAFLSIISTNQS